MLNIPIPNSLKAAADKIIQSRHPEYTRLINSWAKWRLTYEGGEDFVQHYLKKLSDREGDKDYLSRKEIAYVPRFAAAAIDDIKNAIYQRITDVSRKGGPDSYQRAIKGLGDGVDLTGMSMAGYVGTALLPELLTMKRVGVVIDNHANLGRTMADTKDKTPYFGLYRAEDILSWTPRIPIHGFERVLLREYVDEFDDFGLPYNTGTRYRLYSKTEEGVAVYFLDSEGAVLRSALLQVKKIPFVMFELPRSLLQDVCDYQIALMNLESADISFAMKSNLPFYYEFFDPKSEPIFAKPSGVPAAAGTEVEARTSTDKEAKYGTTHGRRFPKDLEKPGFVAPDPGTLQVSMEKGMQLREDIRLLVNLNLVNMNPRRQSADSKEMDQSGLENGLAFIGLVLQQGENELAKRWQEFDKSGDEPFVQYPTTYSIESEEQRFDRAEKLEDLKGKIPSDTFKRTISKRVALLVVGRSVTTEELAAIEREIDAAETLISDPDLVIQAAENGLVGAVTASNALGFKGDIEVPIAQAERVKRMEEVAKAQGGTEGGAARGLPDFDKGQKTSSDEKVGKDKRGQAKKVDK